MRQRAQYFKIIKKEQQGFSLFLVLVILVLIALAVIGGMRWSSSESRSSSNSADRQVALSLAEAAIREAETSLTQKASQDGYTPSTVFKDDCPKGLCLPVKDGKTPYWETKAAFGDNNSAEYPGAIDKDIKKPRYIIEYMGVNNNGTVVDGNTYRITARAWGKNAKTQVTIQVYDELQ